LAFGTVSDPLLAVALWTGCGALAATAVLFLAVVVIRVRLLRRLRREERAAALWNPLLAECTEHVPATLPALATGDAESVLVLWCRAQESLRGEAQDNLRELARRLDLGALANVLLRSGKLRRQLLALVALGHLRDRSVVAALERMAAGAAPVLSITAAHALIRIDAARGAQQAIAVTARREDWPLARVVSMLRECDPQLVGAPLAAAIRAEARSGAGGEGLGRLLRLHVAAHGETLRAAVLEVLAGSSPVALAAALGALWHPEDAAHARRLLGHPEWTVRVAAARALGRFGSAEDFEPLCAVLSDASWWVRYRAAQALCTLMQADSALRALPARLTDRFAADILRQALAERGPA